MKDFLSQRLSWGIVITIFFILILLSTIGYGIFYIKKLNKENLGLKTTLLNTQNDLTQTQDKNASLSNTLEDKQNEVDSLGNQVGEIANTVGTLKKLSETDEELLQKYSKIYFLNENFIPSKLSDIDTKYIYSDDKNLMIHAEVSPYLQKLLENASSSKIELLIISAYRSFGTQSALKDGYTFSYGSGANKFSADQGYSEHQLGTTVDFTTPKVGATFSGFSKTKEYQWLLDNAYKYGFVISYPLENTYYQFEPWHWRFVGVSLARALHNENKYFYDLDQREIDKYLINIFD